MQVKPDSTLREVAFCVCTALERNGQTAILSGGGAATVYAPGAYQSRDLDFILTFSGSASSQPILDLGFRLAGNHYAHQETIYTLDFPPGPLMIGSDYIPNWDTLKEGDWLLHIITPTDSVLDRLVAYVHWQDSESLDVAIRVAKAIGDRLDWERVQQWAESEGAVSASQILRDGIDHKR